MGNVERHHNLFFENMPVRIIIDEGGDPWWVAKDVCDVLEHSNPSVAIDMLDNDERAKKSLGRQGETWIINESGIYSLIIRSNKPQARPFRRWVTHEVLPSIRKTGAYVHPAAGQAGAIGPLAEQLDRIERQVGQFLINSNRVGPAWAFVHECCRVGQQHVVEKEALYQAYQDYCRSRNAHTESRNHFFMRLYHAVHSCYGSTLQRGGRKSYVVRGIGLKDSGQGGAR